LVEPDPTSAGQGYPSDPSPPLLIKRPGEGDAPSFQLPGGRLDVLAQQVQLMIVRLLRGMDRELTGRKREDEPAAAGIHGIETEHVSEERAVGLGIVAIDQRVHA